MLLTTDDFTKYWGESRAFYMSSEIGDMDSSKDKRKRWLAVTITLLMVLGATLGGHIPSYGNVNMDMFFFASIAVVLMAALKIFSAKNIQNQLTGMY